MTRVATIPLQRTMSGAIQKSQQGLAISQMQLNTRKKAHDYAGLGTDAVRTLSARAMLAQQEAHKSVATRVGTTTDLYAAHLNQVDDSMAKLREQLLTAVGTGDGPGLQEAIEAAFTDFRNAMNAREGGLPLFAGAQTDTDPLKPQTLADTIGLDPADAFANDQVRLSARVGDGIDVEYGVVASDVGPDLIRAFRTLAEAGPIGEKPTDAQKLAMRQAIGELDAGVTDLRAVNGEVGRKQNQIETMGVRAEDRALLLEEVIGSVEDADLGQVAIDIAQRKSILEASYSVFSQLSGLSLANFLR
ncbi:hypothetical protein ACFB49_45360 [Sphingomonas sp. DBB INV C78]|uniref:flagellin n=1 Tax=Sphingomonas sp. DBB INV C78 TaxID=3349434 RepID=UPI0036D34695